MTHLRTNAGIFADRGDPWVTEREGEKDFGRIEVKVVTSRNARDTILSKMGRAFVQTEEVLREDPDFDAHWYAGRARPRQPYQDPPINLSPRPPRSARDKLLSDMRAKMRGAMPHNNPNVKAVPQEVGKFTKTQSAKQGFSMWVYARYADGTEEDNEYRTKAGAIAAYRRRARNRKVIRVELYDAEYNILQERGKK